MSIEFARASPLRAAVVVLTTLSLAACGSVSTATQAPAESSALVQSDTARPSAAPRKREVAALRFEIASRTGPAANTLSGQACRAGVETAAEPDPKSDAAISVALHRALVKDLSAKAVVETEAMDPADLPIGTLIIAGCFTQLDPGNAAGRMIGMGIGASRLAAHVTVFTKTPTGVAPLQTFDVKAKGGPLLPPLGPIGLVLHGIKETRETLSADAGRLAGDITARVAPLLQD